jgi:hypothetical protein
MSQANPNEEPNVVKLYRAIEAHLQDALALMKDANIDEHDMVRKLAQKTRAANSAAISLEQLMIHGLPPTPKPSSPNPSTAGGSAKVGQ